MKSDVKQPINTFDLNVRKTATDCSHDFAMHFHGKYRNKHLFPRVRLNQRAFVRSMSWYARSFWALFLCPFIVAWPRINLDHTDPINHDRTELAFPHDCLHTTAWIGKETDPYQILSYCVDEWPSQRTVETRNHARNLTFAELRQLSINSEQLYLWSAPIDLIERYQLYLDLPSFALHSQTFYNCTSPWFGSFCQYSFDFDTASDVSLNELIVDFYRAEYRPTTLTCYTHLQCDRGASTLCLDWSEICDGVVNCRSGIDEESCDQLESNQCRDDEYRCVNGQCISQIFADDDETYFECADRSDKKMKVVNAYLGMIGEPIFTNEDVTCSTYFSPQFAKLSGTCVRDRDLLVQKAMFSVRPANISDQCWSALQCQLSSTDTSYPSCTESTSDPTWSHIINRTCPDLIDLPASTLTFGHLFFLHRKEQMLRPRPVMPAPDYVCYDDQRCGGFSATASRLSFRNATCRRPQDFPLSFNMAVGRSSWRMSYVLTALRDLHRCNTIPPTDSLRCNHSTMYQCKNSSKCISKRRVCDFKKDCDYGDDEVCFFRNGSCPASLSNALFLCKTSESCISSILVDDGKCHCAKDNNGFCEDEPSSIPANRIQISFPTICDRYTELIPIFTDGRNETDETRCHYWHCNNTYTRCNRFWNCWNGADEVDCDPSPLIPCPAHHHICMSPTTYKLMCLPLHQAADTQIDCLGAIDEVSLCNDETDVSFRNIHCTLNNETMCTSLVEDCVADLCNNDKNMSVNEYNETSVVYGERCETAYENMGAIIVRRTPATSKSRTVHFTLTAIDHSPSSTSTSTENTKFIRTDVPTASVAVQQIRHQRCHRGLPLLVWSGNEPNVNGEACLCPPSFYGSTCQYQNQRVAFTLRFQAYSDSQRSLFAIVVMLIDDSDERLIHSHQQFSYLYALDCQNKFNMYLHYANRPKNLTRRYAAHIDVYEKAHVVYRGSFLIPLSFPFLPIQRVATLFDIPRSPVPLKSCSAQQCLHGRCRQYTNDLPNDFFCQCDKGWSGRACDIPQPCNCSSTSLCVGRLSNGRSLCVCPAGKWGPQCRLQSTRCESEQSNPCLNQGQCIPIDEHLVTNKPVKCLCPRGYSGERCEVKDGQLILSFHQEIALPDVMLVHFVRVLDNGPPTNGSAVKRFSLLDRTVVVHWSHPFHIAFIELSKQSYYLLTVQTRHRPSTTLSKTITPTDRCPHLSELLNETIAQYHLIRRIKYYHLACQRHISASSCFYDTGYFCLCDDIGHERQANCFEFDPTTTYDCFGKSSCRNGAQCIQDREVCPRTSACVCPRCFHGTVCQFSSHGLGLSLDGILGYHIRPHLHINDQPMLVQISLAITILMAIAGLINGSLSLITFHNSTILATSCGVLLLGSCITTLMTMLIFALKFVILLVVQLHNIGHGLFLQGQCVSIDFLLRVSLNTNQWLNACVAIERAVIVIKKTSVDTAARKRMTKYVILTLLLINLVTAMDDPIRRQLVNDESHEEEPRTWCVLAYSSSLQTLTTVVNFVHFSVPFLINLCSGAVIIFVTTRQRILVQPRLAYQQILYEQVQRHKHLLLSPIILVLLSIPRLIIYLLSSCMQPVDNAWLYLTGYLVSFLPSMLTFVVFVLPSKVYRDELLKTFKRWKRSTWLRCTVR